MLFSCLADRDGEMALLQQNKESTGLDLFLYFLLTNKVFCVGYKIPQAAEQNSSLLHHGPNVV